MRNERELRIDVGGGVGIHAEAASVTRRVLAAALDAFVLILVAVVLVNMTNTVLAPAFLGLVVPILGALYFAMCECAFGGTIGKISAGLRVIARDGGRLDPLGAFARAIPKLGYLSFPPIIVFDLACMFGSRHGRSLGDLAGGTVVILRRPTPMRFLRTDGRSTFLSNRCERLHPSLVNLIRQALKFELGQDAASFRKLHQRLSATAAQELDESPPPPAQAQRWLEALIEGPPALPSQPMLAAALPTPTPHQSPRTRGRHPPIIRRRR